MWRNNDDRPRQADVIVGLNVDQQALGGGQCRKQQGRHQKRQGRVSKRDMAKPPTLAGVGTRDCDILFDAPDAQEVPRPLEHHTSATTCRRFGFRLAV